MTMLRCASLLLGCLAWLAAGEPLPPEAAKLLAAHQDTPPAVALAAFDAYAGPPHALIHLARGRALLRLAEAGDTTRWAAAEQAFAAAVAADGSLRAARFGVAQCKAAREDWTGAAAAAAAAVDWSEADAATISFVAGAALRGGDLRLAAVAAQQGILRFPADDNLRRLELTVLARAERGEDARQAALALLARHPEDPELWQHLAWSAHATGRSDEALAALELAWMQKPGDASVRRRLAEAQAAAGQPQAALTHLTALIGVPPVGDAGLLATGARVAAAAGDPALGRRWLDAIPADRRTRDHRVQAARLAAQMGDVAGARVHLDALIGAGESDPQVLVWAGSLAEAAQDTPRAEALYTQAAAAGSSAATLRLVSLCLRQQRRAEALTLLSTHLAAHADDLQARRMLDALTGR